MKSNLGAPAGRDGEEGRGRDREEGRGRDGEEENEESVQHIITVSINVFTTTKAAKVLSLSLLLLLVLPRVCYLLCAQLYDDIGRHKILRITILILPSKRLFCTDSTGSSSSPSSV